MRLVNYINEATDEEVLNYFLAETKQYRDMMKGVRLWRAHNHKINGVQKFSHRHERRPKDTPKEVHVWLDAWFKKKFGFKARSDAVFAASTPNGIDMFGKYTDLIYPVNGFKFVYANTIQDLTAWLEDNGYIQQIGTKWYVDPKFEDERYRKDLEKILSREYQHTDLPSASWSSTEVMLHCPNGYYMVGGNDYFRNNFDAIEGDYK